MVLLGDVAHPFIDPPQWATQDLPWTKQMAVANLEGALVEDIHGVLPEMRLANHESIVSALADIDLKVASLANNHITDITGGAVETRKKLLKTGIQPIGAGSGPEEAARPAVTEEDGTRFLFLAFGWRTIHCVSAVPGASGVNPLEAPELLSAVRHWRRADPEARIVVLCHWNYEMELYPQPAHRQLAMAAIDAGASAVVGHHPHCVGGVEVYNGAPMAYSLGNWWFPQKVFFDGCLAYGPTASLEMALEWTPGHEPVLHWFEYCPTDHQLAHLESELLGASRRNHDLAPFAGLTHKEYLAWFRRHRVKRQGLPIYRDYRHQRANQVKDTAVAMRHRLLIGLARCGLRGGRVK